MELTTEQKDFVIKALRQKFGIDVAITRGNMFPDCKDTNTIWRF